MGRAPGQQHRKGGERDRRIQREGGKEREREGEETELCVTSWL